MTTDYDLMVLDIMLPDVNGWEIVRMLRAANKSMPILLLSALGTIEHRVKGLELGADDYLVKPFAFAELTAFGLKDDSTAANAYISFGMLYSMAFFSMNSLY